jgi:hypothetical protein
MSYAFELSPKRGYAPRSIGFWGDSVEHPARWIEKPNENPLPKQTTVLGKLPVYTSESTIPFWCKSLAIIFTPVTLVSDLVITPMFWMVLIIVGVPQVN